jgi:hypothetical protein
MSALTDCIAALGRRRDVSNGPFVSIDIKGGVRTFAALRSKVCNAGQSELSLRLRQWPLTELDHWAMLP